LTRGDLLRLLELLVAFDEEVANDEPAHLACIVLGMHCDAALAERTG
jgi:hypothetical protein